VQALPRADARLGASFPNQDIALLAYTDASHNTRSGLATVRRMRWAWTCYEDARYVRLATISLGHLYNLRKTRSYLARRQAFTKTKPSAVAIGARCAALPGGRASFIRIDSVHQGEQYGVEAQPHINAVDCMTQWAWVATCEAISEAYLLPVIEALLVVFPFRILGLHADNG